MSERRRHLISFVFVALASAGSLAAQDGGPRVAFDVTSVKPSVPDVRSKVDVTPGRFTATSITVRELIKIAYPADGNGVRSDDQVVIDDDWVGKARFDVEATGGPADVVRPAPGAVVPPQSAGLDRMRAMLRTLLAERFAIVLHHESKSMPFTRWCGRTRDDSDRSFGTSASTARRNL